MGHNANRKAGEFKLAARVVGERHFGMEELVAAIESHCSEARFNTRSPILRLPTGIHQRSLLARNTEEVL